MSKKWYKAKVVRGQGKGKLIGFPTANLQRPKDFELKYGIYTAQIKLTGLTCYHGVLYWGTRGGTGESLEIHIFDFDGDLYGKELEFQVGQFIREDLKFDSTDELVKQIAADVAKAKAMLYKRNRRTYEKTRH